MRRWPNSHDFLLLAVGPRGVPGHGPHRCRVHTSATHHAVGEDSGALTAEEDGTYKPKEVNKTTGPKGVNKTTGPKGVNNTTGRINE